LAAIPDRCLPVSVAADNVEIGRHFLAVYRIDAVSAFGKACIFQQLLGLGTSCVNLLSASLRRQQVLVIWQAAKLLDWLPVRSRFCHFEYALAVKRQADRLCAPAGCRMGLFVRFSINITTSLEGTSNGVHAGVAFDVGSAQRCGI